MLAARLGRCWLRTVRPVLPGRWPTGPCVFAIWHEDALLAGALFRRLPSMALVSRSADGEILAEVLGGGKLRSVRGSSSDGGAAAARAILKGLASGVPLVTALDGPRGPVGVAKPGAAWLARRAGVPIHLLRFPQAPCARARDWSRLRIPRPFSRPIAALEPVP